MTTTNLGIFTHNFIKVDEISTTNTSITVAGLNIDKVGRREPGKGNILQLKTKDNNDQTVDKFHKIYLLMPTIHDRWTWIVVARIPEGPRFEFLTIHLMKATDLDLFCFGLQDFF